MMDTGSDWYIKEETEDRLSVKEEFITLSPKEDKLTKAEKIDSDQFIKIKELSTVNWNSVLWTCYYCTQIFRDYTSVTHHQKTSHQIINAESTYQCHDCREQLSGYASFLNHIRGSHYECLKLCCDVCNEILPDYKQLSLHRDKHISNNNYPIIYHCTLCEEVYSEEKKLKDHIKNSHKLKCRLEDEGSDVSKFEEKNEKCQILSNNLDVRCSSNLSNYKDEYKETEPTFQCGKCVKIFSTEIDLQQHMSEHNSKQPFECETCQKGFKNKRTLWGHMKLHIEKQSFECEICFKKLSTKGNLQYHMRTHTDVRAFKCEICAKAFVTKKGLKDHLYLHTGERPFQCNMCPKAFTQSSNLQVHMLIHKGERTFQCNQCSSAFTTKIVLQRHMRTHIDGRPFKCEICSNRFRSKDILKVHTLRHTDERPFKCSICAKGFIRNGILQNHMKTCQRRNEPAVDSP